MSNLAKALNITPSDRHTPGSMENSAVKFQYDVIHNPNEMETEYRLLMRAGVSHIVADYAGQTSQIDTLVKHELKRALIEVVYGEFRAPLAELYKRIGDGDYDKARTSLNVLHNKMFF